jgi:hypothetical protein
MKAVRSLVKEITDEILEAVLECEQQYADAHCHGGALQSMSALHIFFLKDPTQFFSVSRAINIIT